MRTNVVIDDVLMADALNASGLSTKRETIEEALKLYIAVNKQKMIKQFRGKLKWEGNLEKMRLDK